jgi:hypothetical protein
MNCCRTKRPRLAKDVDCNDEIPFEVARSYNKYDAKLGEINSRFKTRCCGRWCLQRVRILSVIGADNIFKVPLDRIERSREQFHHMSYDERYSYLASCIARNVARREGVLSSMPWTLGKVDGEETVWVCAHGLRIVCGFHAEVIYQIARERYPRM